MQSNDAYYLETLSFAAHHLLEYLLNQHLDLHRIRSEQGPRLDLS